MTLEEERSRGIVVSDPIRHLADAARPAHRTDKDEVIRRIFRGTASETREPTAPLAGSFSTKNGLN